MDVAFTKYVLVLNCFFLTILPFCKGASVGNRLRRSIYNNELGYYGKKRMKSDIFQDSLLPQRDPKYDWACISDSDEFTCGNCNTVIICVQGEAYLQPCSFGTLCTYNIDFKGAVCLSEPVNWCQCSGLNEYKADPYNPYFYFVCESSSVNPQIIESCDEGYEFDPRYKSCKPIKNFPICMLEGTYPHVEDCHWYYTCTLDSGTLIWTQVKRRCLQPNTVYSSGFRGCAIPNELPATEVCSAIARAQAAFKPTTTEPPKPEDITITSVITIDAIYKLFTNISSNVFSLNPQYICTFLGKIIVTILPDYIDKVCVRIP